MSEFLLYKLINFLCILCASKKLSIILFVFNYLTAYAPLKLMQAVTNKVNEIFTRYLDNSRLAMLPPPSSKLPPLARSAALKNGKRKMEDRHVEIYDLHTICNVQVNKRPIIFSLFINLLVSA